MYFADISATSLDGLEVCAWCARLSIAGLGCGSKWLVWGGEECDSLCVRERLFVVCLWILYGFFMENAVLLYVRNGVLGSLDREEL
jgi:hypothetical protein